MDFLTKLREALGLDEKASEDKVLETIKAAGADALAPVREALELDEKADAKAIATKITELKDSETPASLEDRAKEEGKVVLDQAEYADVKRQAKAGEDAAKELRQSKFDTAVDKAIEEARLDTKDETRERLQKLYDVAPDETLADIADRPKLVSTAARGERGKVADGETPAGLDAASYELHKRVQAYQREHSEADYMKALDAVQNEEATV